MTHTSARRWMLFVDGENFTLEAEKVAVRQGATLSASDWYRPGVYLWRPSPNATASPVSYGVDRLPLEMHAVRAHFYTSAVGSPEDLDNIRRALHSLGFTPHVFKKDKGSQRSKGVDIAFATDVLANALRNNYDAAVLVAGDGDYVPLVEEIKRAGKLALLWYFDNDSLSPALKLAADDIEDYTRYFNYI